jgi:tetratricopeptide (TPR) repeat protein
VAKRKFLQKVKEVLAPQNNSLEGLQSQLQTLMRQKNYRQALDKLKHIQKTYPDAKLEVSEANILSLRGQQEYGQGNYRQAEKSFHQAIEMGLKGEPHYWLSKCFLSLNEPQQALAVMQHAFEHKKLPKDYMGCYLKLLFLNGEVETATDLVVKPSNRFFAPQLHWAKGMLALQAKDYDAAIAHFKKMGRPATPEDKPSAWIAYAYQQKGDWRSAEMPLGMGYESFGMPSLSSSLPQSPVMHRLRLVQAIGQKKSLEKSKVSLQQQGLQQSLVVMLEFLHLIIEEDNIHEAAHMLKNLERPDREFPELGVLVRPIMVLAGEQALRDQEPECTKAFWESIVYQPPFDPQLILNLREVYAQTGSSGQAQRLLSHLLDGVKQEAKAHPQDWPETRLNPTLARIYCWMTDAWMSKDQRQQGFKALQEAEKLCPDLPDVIGRKGLKAHLQGNREQAIPLLTKALEGGCTSNDVYQGLLQTLEHQEDVNALKEARRKFGKAFGDLNVDSEVSIEPWIEALSTQDYWTFEELVTDTTVKDPAIKACRIFVQSAEGEPNSSNRVGLKQSQAIKQWDKLLESLPSQDQIPVLQAIFLSLQLYTKRQKGIAALQTKYQQQLFALITQHPEAQLAHLMLHVVKGLAPERLMVPLQLYLETAPQPGTALAQLQLKAHWFAQTELLRPALDEALRREPQNPQLLLAKATTYPLESSNYKKFHEEGFELARRLQDAQALQAFREEEFLQSTQIASELFPDFMDFAGTGEIDMMAIMRKMAKKMFGNDVPPAMLEMMLPELMRRMEAEMSGMGFDDDEDDFFEINPFRPPPTKKKGRKSRGFFLD